VIDHMAFRCTGLKDMMEHLELLNVAFRKRQDDD
jgi:hypothetical protein